MKTQNCPDTIPIEICCFQKGLLKKGVVDCTDKQYFPITSNKDMLGKLHGIHVLLTYYTVVLQSSKSVSRHFL